MRAFCLLGVAFLVAGSGSVQAQTFEETAAYITHGLEEKPHVYIRVREAPSLTYKDAKPNGSGNTRTYVYKTISPCVIEIDETIDGPDKKINELFSAALTIDFNAFTDYKIESGPQKRYDKFVMVGGAYKSCSRAVKCSAENDLTWDGPIPRERLAKAMAYMRSAFCKGKAF